MLLVQHEWGVDLTAYKRPQLERRLTSLRHKHGFDDFDDWFEALRVQPGLRAEFLDRITINVSEFFRNPERWRDLTRILMATRGPLRVWSAACARGEEPYTFAMIAESVLKRPYRILATDVDERALAHAVARRYKSHQLQSVPESFLSKYFSRDKDEWVVDAALARHVTFRRHDLTQPGYPGHFDVIICRNVLIYFTEETKREVVRRLTDALAPGGLLFVGSTEQFLYAEQYGLRTEAPFIYRKTSGGG